jgi:hypothetical protein
MNSTYYSKKYNIPEVVVDELMKEVLIDAAGRVTNLPPFDPSSMPVEVFNHIVASKENLLTAFDQQTGMFKAAAEQLIMLPCNDPKNIIPLNPESN